MAKSTKSKTTKAHESLSPPEKTVLNFDRRRRRVEWSKEVPTDGRGNVTLDTLSALVAHLDTACNAVSQWAKFDNYAAPVERLLIRERGKKPRLVVRFTLNHGLAALVATRGAPNFRRI